MLSRDKVICVIVPGARCSIALVLSVLFYLEVLAQPISTQSYCAARHVGVEKTPPELLPLAQKAFDLSASMARDATFVRCVGSTLMGCYVGANLSCGKADKRRILEGATSFCRENPNADVVPMAATGHSTIYDWSCKGRLAVAGKASTAVDAQGFIASNWQKIR